MAEQAQSRVQQAIKEFVNDVDQTHLRPMERNMHLCAADCCGKTTASIDDVHRYDRIKLKYNYSKLRVRVYDSLQYSFQNLLLSK